MEMTCQHENCQRTVVVDCLKPEIFERVRALAGGAVTVEEVNWEDYIEYYCLQHCQAHGYCWHCGLHQGAPPRLDGEGLCDGCAEAQKLDG